METPIAMVRACVQMLPQLMAEESLREAQRVGLGSGSYAKKDARALQRQWRREARGLKRSHQPATAQSIWGGVMHLPGMQVVRVPTSTKAQG